MANTVPERVPGITTIATFSDVVAYSVKKRSPDSNEAPVKITSPSEPHGYCYLFKILHPPMDRVILINAKMEHKEGDTPPCLRMAGMHIDDFKGSMLEFALMPFTVQVLGHRKIGIPEHKNYSYYSKFIHPLVQPAASIMLYFYCDTPLLMTTWTIYTLQNTTASDSEYKKQAAAVMGLLSSQVRIVESGGRPPVP